MATVVDALVVTLALDAKNYNEGLKKAVADLDKAKFEAGVVAKSIEASGKQAALFFTKLRNEAIALFAVFTGFSGAKSFVTSMTASSAAAGRMAHNLGMSVETLTQWENAAELAGGTAASMRGGLQGLTREFQNLQLTGDSSTIPFLRQFGVRSLSELNDIPALLMKIAGAAHEMDPRRANALLSGLGLDQDLINVLIQGQDALRKYLDQAKALGVTTKADAEAAAALEREFHGVRMGAISLGRAILTELSPEVIKILKAMEKWLEVNNEWLKSKIVEAFEKLRDYFKAIDWGKVVANFKAFGAALPGIVDDLGKFLSAVNKVVDALGGWEVVTLSILGLWSAAKFAPVLATLTRLGPLLVPILAALGAAGVFKYIEGHPEVWEKNHPHAPQQPEGASDSIWSRLHRFFFGSSSADTTMNQTQRGFLDTLSEPESGGRYNVKNGGTTFSDYSKFPEGVGENGTSTASGRYQFTSATWKEASAALGLTDFSPVSQDRAAWWLATREYRGKTGRDLHGDLASGGHTADIAAALKGRWPSLPGGSQKPRSQADFDAALMRNTRGASGTPTVDPAMRNGVRPRAVPLASGGGAGSETHIGQIVIHTQATDAEGIARGIGPALRRYGLVSSANYGLA